MRITQLYGSVCVCVCFINPRLSAFQVNLDGRYFPKEKYGTVDDVRFTNLSYDAMNVNNNTLLSLSKDVARSLQPYVTAYTFPNGGGASTGATTLYCPQDASNFFIGIPFSNDEDFMGGINHPGTAQIDLVIKRTDGVNFTVPPTAIFLEDKILKIRAMKPPGGSQISLTNASIEQIRAGAQ